MNIRKLRRLAFAAAAILVLNQLSAGVAHKVHASFQNEPAWVTFVPESEELAATIPAWPTARTYPLNSSRDPDHERVLAHRQYGGYGNGLIFMIESYKAEHPQRLWTDLLGFADQSAEFERDVSFDGVTAREYRSAVSGRYATYTRHVMRFTTKEHAYIVTLVTLEDANPAVDRFVSSLRLRRTDDRSTTSRQPTDYNPVNIFNSNQVTRKAIVVSKPEPSYTQPARAHKTAGTVTLEAVFAEDGYVTNITVTQHLPDGLTESAIDAARNIRFFPAEKDGKPVAQRLMLEYNFNAY